MLAIVMWVTLMKMWWAVYYQNIMNKFPFHRKTIPVDMHVMCVCVCVKLNKWIQCFMLEQMTNNSQYIVTWGRTWGWGKYWGREFCFPDMKTYKAKVIKRVWCWYLDRQMNGKVMETWYIYIWSWWYCRSQEKVIAIRITGNHGLKKKKGKGRKGKGRKKQRLSITHVKHKNQF